MDVQLLSPDRYGGLLEFFDRPDQGFCFCRFWEEDVPNEAWVHGEASAHRAARSAAMDRLEGVVALEGASVIGWLRFAPTASLTKLRTQRLEPVGDAAAYAILCLAVASDARGRGVASALLDHAIAALEARGVAEIHAYPRPEAALGPAEVWTGPRAAFEARGFTAVRCEGRRWTFTRQGTARQ